MNIEMKFSFKAIKELLNETNTTLETIGELSKDLNNISTIAYIGNKYAGGKLTKEEIEDMLEKGNFETALAIVNEFGQQVSAYFSPNEKSQAQ
jgi:hypothetical protein